MALRRFRSSARRSALKRETQWYHVQGSGHVPAPQTVSQAWVIPPDSDYAQHPEVYAQTKRTLVKVICQVTLQTMPYDDGETMDVAWGLIECEEDNSTGLPASNDFPDQEIEAPWIIRQHGMVRVPTGAGIVKYVFQADNANSIFITSKAQRKLDARHGVAILFSLNPGDSQGDIGFGYDIRALVKK